MSGIYVHIPFCRKACHYCNFHFSTNLSSKSKLVNAILKEIEIRASYLNHDKIQTIYFGGGTPSVLNSKELSQIMNAIYKFHNIDDKAEITLEANPDDLTLEKLKELKKATINRLSIGVQSFFEEDLIWMNRSHNKKQAFQSILDAQKVGLDNLSIDLIFGSPSSNNKIWNKNLQKAADLNVSHISCYGLTVEPNTALEKMIKLGKTQKPKEEEFAHQFLDTINMLVAYGYEHYEISNYAKDGSYSRHNTNYWKQKNYLGLGPAAHSFNGKSRQWNISHNPKYINSLESEELNFQQEKLTPTNIFNEYLLTGLRTQWGCEKSRLNNLDQNQVLAFNTTLNKWLASGHMNDIDTSFTLTQKGKLIADNIISSLFLDEVEK